ncbi:ATP-grasp domain-containing protein [Kangiella koreensis]|nr:hypothetical protein [Kangiella koreensis]
MTVGVTKTEFSVNNGVSESLGYGQGFFTSAMKTILIISNSMDIHADLISPIFQKKDQTYFRINLDQFPRDYKILQKYTGKVSKVIIEHIPSGNFIDLNTVGAVWNRRPAPFSFISNDLLNQELAFAKQETEQALFGLLYPLDCFWVSHPVALRGAGWKGEQLNRARNFGFEIPASLVTNCPEEVLKFKSLIRSDLIFKTLSTADLASGSVEDNERVTDGLSTVIVDEEMMENLDAVREIPCHFQEYIQKKYELRVTVVEDAVFAAKIHSQDDERTRVDSRDMSAEILYEATELPEHIKDRCLSLIKSYDLNYSAMDIIVTPDDEYVFLENNPSGNFLYIQQLIPEFNILEKLAATLSREVECRT